MYSLFEISLINENVFLKNFKEKDVFLTKLDVGFTLANCMPMIKKVALAVFFCSL